jgi:hypothetical protein
LNILRTLKNFLEIFKKQNHHISQTLGFRNGYRQSKQPQFGPGGDRLNYNQLSESELALLQNYQPSIIYGRTKPEPPNNFVPATVAFDKKVDFTFMTDSI